MTEQQINTILTAHLVDDCLQTQKSVKIAERPSWDEVEDIHEIVKELKAITPGTYHVRKRGRGPRKMHENYKRQYQCSIPLDKAAYIAVYIEKR
jgi:hypothetical protein